MKTTPLFAIITVCRNAAEVIGRTLASVDAQTFGDYEHLIVDGASTDDTTRVVERMPNANRRLVSEPDRGIYDAMNKGMSLTRGKYLIFLNAGDAFHSPDVLARYAEGIRKNDTPGIVYAQTDIVDTEGRRLGPRHLTAPDELTLKSFRNGMLVCHQAFVALRRIAPRYNLKYRFSADYDWCIQCLQHSRRNVGITDMVAIDYLVEGATTKNRVASLRERFRIMCYYYGTVPTAARHIGFAFRAAMRAITHKKK